MMRGLYTIVISMLLLNILSGCSDEDKDLPTVEERKEEAIENLVDLLSSPQHGWKLNYQPTETSGSYFMILDFNDKGEVRILSDVAVNDGEFFDHTILYRIDVALNLELILETYGVFHYLFDLERASFGAEFEFLFVEEDGDNLLFESKSDAANPTQLVFQPATSADASGFATEIAANFSLYDQAKRSVLFEGENPTMQLYFSDLDLSVFWSTDFDRRKLVIDGFGKGRSIEGLVTNGFQSSGSEFEFSFRDDQFQLNEPFNFSFAGSNYSISSLNLNDISMDGEAFCNDINTPIYSGSVTNMGGFQMTQTLFKSSGLGFQPIDSAMYSVNSIFVFDQNLASLAEDGSIIETLPSTVAFLYAYDFENDSIPANATGFIVEDENNNRDYYMRLYEEVSVSGNEFNINLTDEYYFSSKPSESDSLALKNITEEIFEGGQFYSYQQEGVDFVLFRLFNPCNQYEWMLVQ